MHSIMTIIIVCSVEKLFINFYATINITISNNGGKIEM